jgi:hypothetical protein
MGILLAFAPFIVFALVDRFLNAETGLIAAAVTSALLVTRDVLTAGRRVKVLEVGTLFLFAGLASYAYLENPGWSVLAVRLRVDAGLLMLIIATLAIGRPFTLPYAKEQVAPEIWSSPEFKRTNNVISLAWATAFALMVSADLLMLYRPDVSTRIGIFLTIASLVAAYKFTAWYPERAKHVSA